MKAMPWRWIALAALVAGVTGAFVAMNLLLPLPPATDIYAARRWGVGAGYVGFILGFPFTSLWVPLSVAVHPFPVGDDATGAGAEVAIMTVIVGVNWACCAGGALIVISVLRRKYRGTSAQASRPPA